MTTLSEASTARPQDRVIQRELKPRRDWAKLGLGTYFDAHSKRWRLA